MEKEFVATCIVLLWGAGSYLVEHIGSLFEIMFWVFVIKYLFHDKT